MKGRETMGRRGRGWGEVDGEREAEEWRRVSMGVKGKERERER